MRRALALILGVAALAGCNREVQQDPSAAETGIPDELKVEAAPRQPAAEAGIGTPMAERVATIGLLNKRNNVSQSLDMKPGEQRRIGNVIIRLQACERTAPWEMPKETGAFVQVLVKERGTQDQFRKVFSGWLFKNSPSLNVVEHPIYDVWVKDCKMDFPGDAPEANRATDEGSAPAPGNAPAAPATPGASAEPSPAPIASESNDT